MTDSVLVADPAGPDLQQQVVASVGCTHPVQGDYGVHVGVTHVLPGGATDDLLHEVPEVVVVVGGELEMWVDGSRSKVRPGAHFVVPPGAWHRFVNVSDAPATMVFAFGGDPAPVTTRRTPTV